MKRMLEIQNLSVNYGAIQALQSISLEVLEGEIVTLIGANGAGKSTTLKAISRLVDAVSGQILYEGKNINNLSCDRLVKMGIAHSPEGRRVLCRQNVITNLQLGAYTRSDAHGIRADLEKQFLTFPRLSERRHQLAGTLSGGEQQMLAIARALMSRPRLLLLDEPSLGLAPQIVKEIFAAIELQRDRGVTILLVEQNANLALNISDRAYVLEAGQLTVSGSSRDLIMDEKIRKAYFG
jgi:branched-chain amino acid transport system ATP-binding protein